MLSSHVESPDGSESTSNTGNWTRSRFNPTDPGGQSMVLSGHSNGRAPSSRIPGRLSQNSIQLAARRKLLPGRQAAQSPAAAQGRNPSPPIVISARFPPECFQVSGITWRLGNHGRPTKAGLGPRSAKVGTESNGSAGAGASAPQTHSVVAWPRLAPKRRRPPSQSGEPGAGGTWW